MEEYQKKTKAFENAPSQEDSVNSISIEMEGDKETKEKTKKKNKNDDDVWAIDFDTHDENYVKWKDMSTKEKVNTTIINIFKILSAISFLYLFICSISMLGDAFQILAGKSAGEIFSNDSFLSNAVSGLIVGILVTVLVQSSSTSTSIVTTMVAAGILDVETAVPIIMGANIGTSVTNTLVSLSQSLETSQFRKAFAGATVHDIFNLLSVLILLPLEEASHFLFILTKAIIDSFNIKGGTDAPDLLKVITNPVVKGIVQVNKTVIELVAQEIDLLPNASMIKVWCEQEDGYIDVVEEYNKTLTITISPNEAVTDILEATTFYQQKVKVGVKKCSSPEDFLFANTGLSDVEAGIILLFMALIIMTICLYFMVKLLSSLLRGSVAKIIKKVINTNFRYPFGWCTGYLAILVGAGLTFLVQSSSVFTSILTPLVGLGVISLKRMFPLTLGANIGTTTTSLLAALASDGNRLAFSLQISLVHLFFNIFGITLWYPIPFMRNIPIRGAKALGNITAKYKWFAVLYIIFVFFVFPGILLALSFAGVWALMSVVIVVLIIVAFIIVVNILQTRKPNWLPKILRNWKFLPIWMRSLAPYDNFMSKYLMCCCKKSMVNKEDESSIAGYSSSLNESTNKAFVDDENSITKSSKL